jgi:hypothetical protein
VVDEGEIIAIVGYLGHLCLLVCRQHTGYAPQG